MLIGFSENDGESQRVEDNTFRLQQLFKNPRPVPSQDFFDLLVAESALDQSASEISRVGMISEIGNEMRGSEFGGELFLR